MIALYSCLKFAPGESRFPEPCRLIRKAFAHWLPGMKNVGFASYVINVAMREIVLQLRTDKVGDLAAQFAGNCRLEHRPRPATARRDRFLATTNADILILQEADLNARRTHA